MCVDDPVNIQELERAAHLAGSRIYVYVELDVGMQRCGVSDFEQVLYLARQIEQSEHLVFGGIQAYAGQLSHEEDVVKRNRRFTRSKHCFARKSVSGTASRHGERDQWSQHSDCRGKS
ncbi:MAG: alanine racemase [Clostridia bacterium]